MNAPSAPALHPGEQIGRYRVEAFVAGGGMGDVFKAWDASLERFVALKTIRGELAGHSSVLLRFQREAQILAKLDHPCICQVYDWVDRDGTFVMAMEWVEGASLGARLAGGPMPAKEAVAVLRGIASALAAAHGRGIIHRDLKPSNVILGSTGQPKVLDFGLAKTSGDSEPQPVHAPIVQDDLPTRAGHALPLTESGVVMGTRGFLAPERILGAPPTAAVDIFALGVLACLMLTGELPSARQVSGRHASRPRLRQDPRAKGPAPRQAALWRLVEDMLTPEAKERPTAAQVLSRLDRLQAPPSPWWWAGGATAATLLLVASGLWFYGRGVLPEYSAGKKARVIVVPVRNLTGDPTLNGSAEVTRELLEQSLQRFPTLRVVREPQPDAREPGVHLEGIDLASEQAYLNGVVARTGADLVIVGEIRKGDGASGKLLLTRLLDAKGTLRAKESFQAAKPEFEPGVAVPALLLALSHQLSPLGGQPDLLTPPSIRALDAFGSALEAEQNGRGEECRALLEKAVELDHRYALAVLRLGRFLNEKGDQGAMPTLRWAQALFREAGDPIGQSEALFSLSELAATSSLRETRLHEVLDLARASGETDIEAKARNQLGEVAFLRNDLAVAEGLHLQALDLFRRTGYRPLMPSVLINLGNVAKARGDLGAARRRYLEAREAAEFKGGVDLQARALNNLAVIELNEQRAEAAETVFEGILTLREKLNDARGVSRVQLNLGIAAQMRGDLAKAKGRYLAALAKAEAIHSRDLEGKAHFRLGDLLRSQGRFPEAHQELQAARRILVGEQTGSKGNQAETLSTLAETLARMGQTSEAEGFLREARQLSPDLPQVMRAQAWIQRSRGQGRLALESLEKALEDPRMDDPEHKTEVQRLLAAWRKGP